jgi:hypothetical protein
MQQTAERTTRYLGRYVGSQGRGTCHVLTARKPDGATSDHPFWRHRTHTNLCGRTIEASATADRYWNGTPIPVCRRCERASASGRFGSRP